MKTVEQSGKEEKGMIFQRCLVRQGSESPSIHAYTNISKLCEICNSKREDFS